MTDIRVPTLGESVTEATVAKWFKAVGETVKKDEPLVELETDKVTVEVPAPSAGTLESISVQPGATVQIGAVLGAIANGAGAAAPVAAQPKPIAVAPTPPAPPPVVPTSPAQQGTTGSPQPLSPSVRRIVEEEKLNPSGIAATGRDGRITKGDALAALEGRSAPAVAPAPAAAPAPQPAAPAPAAQAPAPAARATAAREERVPMTRLRKTIATRLKEAQNTAAMLTTYNEADMSAIMALRAEFKDSFEKRHGVRLGFMGFFVKACCAALRDIPVVNASIDGDDIVYKNHYDIGVAVATDRGLVVPVIRDADQMSVAEIEKKIADFGARARDGHLKLDELQGGTFSISNGGVFGSLMSMPILNAPQSAILGMHKIQERPVAIAGKVEIRPMMYLAVSYDHRLVDGRDAVTFLVRVKENLETPQRLLLDV